MITIVNRNAGNYIKKLLEKIYTLKNLKWDIL